MKQGRRVPRTDPARHTPETQHSSDPLPVFSASPGQIAETLVSCNASETSIPFRAELGREVHQLQQSLHPDWLHEHFVRLNYRHPKAILNLSGRIDLLKIEAGILRIREIKSVIAMDGEAAPSIIERASLQASIYALMLTRSEQLNSREIEVSVLLVNLADASTSLIPLHLSLDQIDHQLAAYIDLLIEASNRDQAETARRSEIATALDWPYSSIRPAQELMLDTVGEAVRDESILLLDAPPGSGKTMGVLYPALRHSLRQNRQVFFATAKGGGRSPVRTAASLLLRHQPRLRVLILSAQAEYTHLCQLCGGECSGRPDAEMPSVDAEVFYGRIVDQSVVTDLANQKSVCPLQVVRRLIGYADLVVGDYNFVFDPARTIAAFHDEGTINWMLLIDEAHNLPARAQEMFSVELRLDELLARRERFFDDAWRSPNRAAAETIIGCLDEAISEITRHLEDALNSLAPIEPDFVKWKNITRTFGEAVGKYLVGWGERIDPDLQTDVWRSFEEFQQLSSALAFDHNRFHPFVNGQERAIGVRCIDASTELSLQIKQFRGVTAFSGTLHPIETSAHELGIAGIPFAELEIPVMEDDRLRVILHRGIETRLRERGRSARRVARLISDFVQLTPGRVMAVFPSFAYIELVSDYLRDFGLTDIRQTPGMSESERRLLLERPESHLHSVVMAVAGGQFSEAVEFPGGTCRGIVVIGPCLPPPDYWNILRRNYWSEIGEDAEQVVFTAPAIRKVIQAAGRMTRKPSDRGVLLLLDDRFLSDPIYRLLPGSWQQMVQQEGNWKALVKEYWEENSGVSEWSDGE